MNKTNVENCDYSNVFVKTERLSEEEMEYELEETPECDIIKVEIKTERDESPFDDG
jgi:hypothetical protein